MTAQIPITPQINRPFFDKKTGAIALVSVLALHGIVAVGLANMIIPEIKQPKVTPPLEIAFIHPPPPVEIKPEDIKLDPKPEPIEPNIEPKKAEPKIEKKIEPKPVIKPIEKPIEKPVEHPIKPPPKAIKEPKTAVFISPEPDQNLIMAKKLAEANERAEQEQERQQALAKQQEIERQQALAKQQEIARQKTLDEQKASERQQAEDEARRKAKAENDAKAQKAKDDAQKAAQSNVPVNFSAGQASWRRQPNFSCNIDTLGDVLTASFRYIVDKQGNASVVQTKSTGNAKVDRQLLMQAKTGKFNPFTKGGVPVVGVVMLPVRCQ